MNHASEPFSRTTFATARTLAGVMRQAPSFVKNAGIGRPHDRWREMHQSGRDSSIPRMRLRPHSGTKSTSPPSARGLVAASAIWRRFTFAPCPPSTDTNHCSVHRKIVGVLERQSCGYECMKRWS